MNQSWLFFFCLLPSVLHLLCLTSPHTSSHVKSSGGSSGYHLLQPSLRCADFHIWTLASSSTYLSLSFPYYLFTTKRPSLSSFIFLMETNLRAIVLLLDHTDKPFICFSVTQWMLFIHWLTRVLPLVLSFPSLFGASIPSTPLVVHWSAKGSH